MMISKTFKKITRIFTKEEVSTTSFVTAGASHVGSFFVDVFKAVGHAGMAVLKAVTCAVSTFYGEKFDQDAGIAALTETKDVVVKLAHAAYHAVAGIADIAVAVGDVVVAALEHNTDETGSDLAVADNGLDSSDVLTTLAGEYVVDTLAGEGEYAVDAA